MKSKWIKQSLNIIVFITFLLSSMWTWLSIRQMPTEEPINEVIVSILPKFRIISQQNLSIWSKGTVLEADSAAYFYAAKPLIEVTPYLELKGLYQGEIHGTISPFITIRSINDKAESFWRDTLQVWPSKEFSTTFVAGNGMDQLSLIDRAITIDATKAYVKATQISEELQFYGGTYQLVIGYSIHLSGMVNASPFDKTMIQELPIALGQVSFNIPKTHELESQITLVTDREEAPSTGRVSSIIRTYPIQLSITFILALLFVLLLNFSKSHKPKQAKEHRRFKEWITEGSVNVGNKLIIHIFALEGLVDLAIDIDKRVIYNPETDQYYVLADDMIYAYNMKHLKNQDNKQQLGKMLLELGLLTPEQLEIGLYYQEKIGRRLGESLIALGFIKEATLYSTLAAQLRMDYYEIETPKDIDHYDSIWFKKLSVNQARALMALPLGRRVDGKLVVACGESYGEGKLKVLEELFEEPLHLVMARPSAIFELLDKIAARKDPRKDSAITATANMTSDQSISDQEYEKFIGFYYRGILDHKTLLEISGMINPQLLTQIPENENVLQWLSENNDIQQELFQILLGFDKTIKQMTFQERQSNQIPDMLEVLHQANYISFDTLAWAKQEIQLQKKPMDVLFIENYLVSSHTLKDVKLLLNSLERILNKKKENFNSE